LNKKLKDTKQQLKRHQIIEAAARLMVQKGIEKTSLSDIANEAGISKGSLYYYYASKDDLIFDITDTHINQISENLFSIIDARRGNADWKDVLKLLFERIMAAETRGRLHLYLIHQALNGNELLMERFRKKYREWNEMIRDGFEKIKPGDDDYKNLSLLIIAALDGFLIQSLLGLETIDADEFVNHLKSGI
jgi:AcrR family transcriptional regulator